MLKKTNGRIRVPRLCEEKHETALVPLHFVQGEFIKVIYLNWIMWVFTPTAVYRGFPLLCEHDMQIESGNLHTKGDIKLWFDPTFFTLTTAACNSFVDTQPAPEPVQTAAPPKEKNMFDEFDDLETESRSTESERTRRFFLNELAAETDEAFMKARKKFHVDPDTPKTFNEMIQRIQAGKYQVKEYRKRNVDSDIHFNPYSAADWIEWRDPGTEPDEAGYAKASEAIRNRQTELGHHIRVANLSELPAIIKEMRAVTVH